MRALRIALDFDLLEADGNPAVRPVAVMRGSEGCYDAQILEAPVAMREISSEKTLLLGLMRNASAGLPATPEFAVAFLAAHLPCAIAGEAIRAG